MTTTCQCFEIEETKSEGMRYRGRAKGYESRGEEGRS